VARPCPHDYILLVRQQHGAHIGLLAARHQETLYNATRHSAECEDCFRHAGESLPYDNRCGKIRMPNWIDTSNHDALCRSQSRHGLSNREELISIENSMYECHAMQYVLSGVETWKGLLRQGISDQHKSAAVVLLLQKCENFVWQAWNKNRLFELERTLHNEKYKKLSLSLKRNYHEEQSADEVVQCLKITACQEEIRLLRTQVRLESVCVQDDHRWEAALMWVCYWDTVPNETKRWATDYQNLRQRFRPFWQNDLDIYKKYFVVCSQEFALEARLVQFFQNNEVSSQILTRYQKFPLDDDYWDCQNEGPDSEIYDSFSDVSDSPPASPRFYQRHIHSRTEADESSSGEEEDLQ